jgi:hypothetical protein
MALGVLGLADADQSTEPYVKYREGETSLFNSIFSTKRASYERSINPCLTTCHGWTLASEQWKNQSAVTNRPHYKRCSEEREIMSATSTKQVVGKNDAGAWRAR